MSWVAIANEDRGEDCSSPRLGVPGPGIEPGWIAPTVFETVASTDSAIRAWIVSVIWDGERMCGINDGNKGNKYFWNEYKRAC